MPDSLGSVSRGVGRFPGRLHGGRISNKTPTVAVDACRSVVGVGNRDGKFGLAAVANRSFSRKSGKGLALFGPAICL